MKKETKIIVWIIIALIAILAITFIGKKIYRYQLESNIKTAFMRTSDPNFMPVDVKFVSSKTIIYEYSVKDETVYQDVNSHLNAFYQHVLASTCVLNREEIHSGVKMTYRFYFRPVNQTAEINSPEFLFLEVPVSNETCRLIVSGQLS